MDKNLIETFPNSISPEINQRKGTGNLNYSDSSIDLNKTSTSRWIDHKELALHSDERSAWIAIRGKVYDVTRFLQYHPGGRETLLFGAGRDATQVFETYHSLCIKDRLSSFYVGELIGVSTLPTFLEPSPFFKAIKQKTNTYFLNTQQDPKHPPFMWTRYLCLFLCLASFWYFQTVSNHYVSYASAIGLGVCCALLGLHPLHDASHFTVTSKPWLWKWVASTHDFFNGASHVIWIYQHVFGHHPYTNLKEADPDVTTGFRRLYPTQPWFPYHHYQQVWLPFLYGFLAWKTRVQDILILLEGYNGAIRLNPLTWEQRLIFWGGKAFFLVYRIAVPIVYFNLSWTQCFLCLFISDLVTSYHLAFAFQSNHLVEQATLPEWDPSIPMDWAELQVQSTLDYACTNPWVTYFTGSLNFQVLHHLFPGVHPSYYPSLWDMVKVTCKEHQLKYLYVDDILKAFQSHLGHLKNMAEPKVLKST